MNTKQFQFNRQRVASLLLAGLILALAVSLAWTGADESGSTFQPAQMGLPWSQLSTVRGGKNGIEPDRADYVGRESGLSPESQLRAVAGSKLGAGMDGRTDFWGSESGLLSLSHLRSIKAGKMGSSAGGID